MRDRPDRDERIILDLLAAEATGDSPRERDAAERGDAELSDEEREEARALTELAGLLPYALDPVEPRPELKGELLAALEVATGSPRADDREPAAERAIERADGEGPSSDRRRPAARWPLALAASVILLLAAFSVLLFGRLEDSQRAVALLSQQVTELQQQQASLEQSLSRLSLATAAGVEVCPLRPTGDAPPQPDARGVLYVAPERNRWYLHTSGLDPLPAGRAYHVWFLTPDGPFHGGSFRPGDDRNADLLSRRTLGVTRGVMVTVGGDEQMEAPQGAMLLYGDEAMIL